MKKDWQLVFYKKKKDKIFATKGTVGFATITFQPKNDGPAARFSGTAGCNFINGSYSVPGPQLISFDGPIASTRRFCIAELQPSEAVFIAALKNMK